MLGHVQLKVADADLADTDPVYCDLLGFEVGARTGSRFLGVGPGEHRSMIVVTNRFGTGASAAAPADSARLLAVNFTLPGAHDVEARRAGAGSGSSGRADRRNTDCSGPVGQFAAVRPGRRMLTGPRDRLR
ncbi:hypothetical protein [Amycolatopsis benzoatilytica]|uniref:hypothetical protein n=1 Tax=Amycolatopsis benzoatilytica TaxID=346045 RepID=UPI00039BD939|nr:hypothetical protein [Amycolatopsis benzoatilytica]